MSSPLKRRLYSYALLTALAVLSVAAMWRTRKPFSVSSPDYRRMGNVSAKILIIEFSDFQCPACRYAEPALRQVFSIYKGKFKFVFKHYPLPMHPWAKPAAVAAECAGRQGKFWEYHDRLYDQQDSWTNEKADDFFARYAGDLTLDLPAWQRCRQDAATDSAIASDKLDGQNAWVGSTPTFFINGRRFLGGKQLAEIGTLFIDRELKK